MSDHGSEELVFTAERIIRAAEALSKKLKEVDASPEYKGLYSLGYAHGITYQGPNYGKELADLDKWLQHREEVIKKLIRSYKE